MLFTSITFLFGFLPVALVGFWLSCLNGQAASRIWLILASLVFYGFWAPYLVILITVSMVFNYSLSVGIRGSSKRPSLQQALLLTGIIIDLGALFYYKYLPAIISYVNGFGWFHVVGFEGIVLPLGISFFTFTQIGYLVDCRAAVTKDNNFIDYILFVTFFPHLIAGPILHNGEMMPQFASRKMLGFQSENFAAGLTIFIIGMSKKSVIADSLSPLVAPGFLNAGSLHAAGAWGAALSYSLQIYFDFSGYSDMAIGLALMFNIRFPANFNSPYKARSIIDFWQRWHITLTRFLTQYLYNPVALSIRRRRIARGFSVSRKAQETPSAVLMLVVFPTTATMLLAGIWHGAGLQFVAYGALHGVYLTVNHVWRMYRSAPSQRSRPLVRRVAVVAMNMALTYLAVLVAEVFFRSNSCTDAVDMLTAMLGLRGFTGGATSGNPTRQAALIILGFVLALCFPNTQQIMATAKPVLGRLPPPAPSVLQWRLSLPWAITAGFLGTLALLSLGGTVEFLYFQF